LFLAIILNVSILSKNGRIWSINISFERARHYSRWELCFTIDTRMLEIIQNKYSIHSSRKYRWFLCMTDKTSWAYDMTLDLPFFRIHGHNHAALGFSIIINSLLKLGLIRIVSSHLHLGCFRVLLLYIIC